MFSNIKYMILVSFTVQYFAKNGLACLTQDREMGICGPLENCYGLYRPISLLPPESKRVSEHLSRYACMKNGEDLICCPKRFQPPERTFPYDPQNHAHLGIFPYFGQYRLPQPPLGTRMAYGYEAPLNIFIFMALLQYNTSTGLKFQCGGSIITDLYILTAAHCVKPEDHLVSVRVGEHNTATELDCSDEMESETDYNYVYGCADPVQDIEIAAIVPHREFNNPNIANNIALIRLKTPIDFSKNNVKPIYLPSTTELQTKRMSHLEIAGWGITEKNVISNVLMTATVPVRPITVCESAFPLDTFFDWEICAGGGTGSTDPEASACRGDSGGPVFSYEVVNQIVQPIQFGIVAAGGIGCGQNISAPSVYTNVPHFIKWILDNIHP